MSDVETETAVARAVGASPEVADAAVAAVAERGLLEHGLLFLAVLAAARLGSDVVDALGRFAAGDEPPSSWSDYEARTAREEAQDEARQALRRASGDDTDEVWAQRARRALEAYAEG